MVTKADYPKDEVEACLTVMVELMTLLGEFRDSIVLVGGWVPYFLFKEKKQAHTGSLDIDIALNFKKINFKTYKTILHILKERGYEQAEQPYSFCRTIKAVDGAPAIVNVNLLGGEYGGTGKTHRTQKVQDVRVRKARGCDLVFENNFSIKLCRKMPDGAKNEAIIKVADIIPFLVMKGMALWDRYKEKDAYDIYFSILHYPGGIQGLANVFHSFKSNKLVLEGLGKIKAKFINIDAPGPVWLTNFEEIGDEEEKERVRRDAFERINAFLEALDIEPFQEKND